MVSISSKMDSLKKWNNNFSVAAAVILALLNIIPILMIVLGAINKDRCPANRNIPVWLIVAGSCALIRSAINFAYRFRVSTWITENDKVL